MRGRIIIGLALATLLAACGGRVRPGKPSPAPVAGLAGIWIPVASPADRDRTACAGDVGIRFSADGRYEMLEEAGRWALDGGRLVMTPARGKPTSAMLRHVGAAIVLTYPDGHGETLARCP